MTADRPRNDDLTALEILHGREVLGLSMREAAVRVGVSRNTAIGLVKRINEAADAVPCRCRRKANRDGGMASRWWAQ
ncbi:MAG: hypothetical protein EP318_15515 [Rhodobacteraceae bacterium]|nr:MAG: hypothetical protein EP318_15515 [Paracoccaceae bacterium]